MNDEWDISKPITDKATSFVSEKLFLSAFRGGNGARPPFWFMRQAGRYLPEYQALRRETPDFLTFCYKPELAIEAALQPLRRFNPDAAILFSDILVVPDALGCDVRFVEGHGPVLSPIRSVSDVDKLQPERVEEYLDPVFQAVRGLAAAIPTHTALIGFAGSPWTLAVYMVEGRGGTTGENVRLWSYREPETFAKLMGLLTDAIVTYVRRQVENGAEAVQLFDSWAGILSDTQFRSWVIEPTAKIVRQLKADFPNVPIIGFPKGAGILYQHYAVETGVDGVSIDAAVPAAWASGTLQDKWLVQGNLDNLAVVAGGKIMEQETRRILDTLADGPFVFNFGHGILPQTPPEHIERTADLVRNWRRD
jgi:uroporphyrinogen decarboxylase